MRLLLIAALIFGSTSSLAAGAYRWTDAQGQVHFSDQPPADSVQSERISIKYSPGDPSAAQPSLTHKPTTAATSKPQSAAAPLDAKTKAENCRKAKANKELLSRSASTRFKQADGSVRPFTDEERAKQSSLADQAIQAYCN